MKEKEHLLYGAYKVSIILFSIIYPRKKVNRIKVS